MRKRIEKELLRLGAPTGRMGYGQMVGVLELIMRDDRVTSATRVLYPKVADRFETRPERIERNVREEIRAIWDYGNQKRLDELFINRGKCPPGNKEFLYTLARHMEQEQPSYTN